MKKIITIDLDLQISKIYCDLVKAFNSIRANKLLSYYKDNLEIDLEPDTKLFFKLIYKLSANEIELLYKYLNSSLMSRFI